MSFSPSRHTPFLLDLLPHREELLLPCCADPAEYREVLHHRPQGVGLGLEGRQAFGHSLTLQKPSLHVGDGFYQRVLAVHHFAGHLGSLCFKLGSVFADVN